MKQKKNSYLENVIVNKKNLTTWNKQTSKAAYYFDVDIILFGDS